MASTSMVFTTQHTPVFENGETHVVVPDANSYQYPPNRMPLTPMTTPDAFSSPHSYFDSRRPSQTYQHRPSSYPSPFGCDVVHLSQTGPIMQPQPYSPESILLTPPSENAALTSRRPSSSVIPPLVAPPCLGIPFPLDQIEDWDKLPEILRQPNKKDGTPPRPMNAYFVYMRVRRPQIANCNPTFTTGQISRELGSEWSKMSSATKAPWNDLADRLLRAFKKKFPEYQYERCSSKKRRRSAPIAVTPIMASHLAARNGRSYSHNYEVHPQYRHQPYPVLSYQQAGPSVYYSDSMANVPQQQQSYYYALPDEVATPAYAEWQPPSATGLFNQPEFADPALTYGMPNNMPYTPAPVRHHSTSMYVPSSPNVDDYLVQV